jgi:hypothetical protein
MPLMGSGSRLDVVADSSVASGASGRDGTRKAVVSFSSDSECDIT